MGDPGTGKEGGRPRDWEGGWETQGLVGRVGDPGTGREGLRPNDW